MTGSATPATPATPPGREARVPLLELRDLRVTFPVAGGVARAVDGLDLLVEAGETVGLVGESGCGKSVTALAILRLVGPDGHIAHGSSVRLEGRDLLALPGKEMRAVRGNHVALVFQEPLSALNPVLRIGAQIAEAVRAHESVTRATARWRAIEMLTMVGLPEAERRARQYPHQLSGGMRQRVMIAMALVCRPKLLIADEPTTALDVTIQAEILELLAELQRKLGMAVLLITHNLGLVAETTQRVAVMYGGQIVEEAATEALFARAAHPYTEGLLAAVPRLDEPRERLRVIPGQVPPATSWPAGCRFHPRCPYAWERCRTEAPPLLEAAPGHRARCWLVEEPARRTRADAPPGEKP
ncbi:MAG: ABC transporter ATP-binding protein [Gemmatimonadetes bacterium]|nr:ABC transporter ATP-binding protein [Gemmatimonadota bacterium]